MHYCILLLRSFANLIILPCIPSFFKVWKYIINLCNTFTHNLITIKIITKTLVLINSYRAHLTWHLFKRLKFLLWTMFWLSGLLFFFYCCECFCPFFSFSVSIIRNVITFNINKFYRWHRDKIYEKSWKIFKRNYKQKMLDCRYYII